MIQLAFGIMTMIVFGICTLYQGPLTREYEVVSTKAANYRLALPPTLFPFNFFFQESHSEQKGGLDSPASFYSTEKTVREIPVSNVSFLLGTDQAGRSIAAGLIRGVKAAFFPALISVASMMGFSILLGSITGFSDGLLEKIVNMMFRALNALPGLVLVIIAGYMSRRSLLFIMIAVGIANIPRLTMQIRNEIQRFRDNQFIEAARQMGLSNFTIVGKHILWKNCRTILFREAAFCMASAILIETTLSFLGIGPEPLEGTTSWGYMVAFGKSMIFKNKFWVSGIPAMAVILSIFGFYSLGEGAARIIEKRKIDR